MVRGARSFTVLIRWRSAADSTLELDTRHGGFGSAEEAAMAANGLGCGGFDSLLLERGGLFTVGVNGQRSPVDEEIVVWTRPSTPLDLPEDLQFERVDDSAGVLSMKGLDSVFEARRFRVLEDASGRDVAVRFALGGSRVVVLVGGLTAVRAPDVEVPLA